MVPLHKTLKLKLLYALMTVVFILSSCSKDEVKPTKPTPPTDPNAPTDTTSTTGPTTGGPNIYVAGYEYVEDPSGFGSVFKVAKIWKNGVATSLTDGTDDAEASSVFVNGNDVYAAGWARIGDNFIAMLWKNGKATQLSSRLSYATSVVIDGSDVYVAGYDYPEQGKENAVIWKNGVRMPLSNGTNNVDNYALSIAVNKQHTYIAGADDNNALMWIFGAETSITKKYGYAQQIILSGEDYYIAGEAGAPYLTQGSADEDHIPQATIWKNGTSTMTLTGKEGGASVANSVAVSGKNVYGAGYEYQYKDADKHYAAVLWKNGSPTLLSKYYSTASTVLVSDSDVYVAGYDSKVANPFTVKGIVTVWKNGVATHYTDGTQDARGNSMFIKK